MLKKIDRSDFEFPVAEFDYVNEYFAWEHNGQICCYLHTQQAPNTDFIQLHIAPQKFSLSILKAMRSAFQELKAGFRRSGIKKIIGAKVEPWDEWSRLVVLLGFNKPVDTMLGDKPAKLIVMEV